MTIALGLPTVSATTVVSNSVESSAIFAAPLPPTYYSPANGATGVVSPVELRFNNAVGALRYNVQVATDAGFTHIVYHLNVPHTAVKFTAPVAGATYYWRVQTVGSDGTGKFGAAWKFTTLSPVLAAPTLLTPLNGAYGVPLSVPLRFTLVTGATRYNVQVSTDPKFSTMVFKTNVAHSPVTFTAANPGLFYWRVQAVGASSSSKYSAIWSFSNAERDLPSLSAPVLLTPLNGSMNQPVSVELRCAAVEGAVRYNVQVASDYAFGNILWKTNVPRCQAKFNGKAGTHYYWRAQSESLTESSLFSAPFGFTMISTEASSLSAVSSFDAAETIPTSYTLHENYPNPFNPSTTIMVDVPEATHIKLAVYDLLGQEVIQIAAGDVEAGTHSYTIDASGLSSGLYLYRIESAAFTQTRRMMLLK
ncbi:MAG: T9SS type A sorting domain-containing protein [Rhodothermales bacterium]